VPEPTRRAPKTGSSATSSSGSIASAARDADALALPAGKLMRKARERVGVETDETHQLAPALMRGAFGHADIYWALGDRRRRAARN